MVPPERRKMTFREAWRYKERREGYAIGVGPGLIRLVQVLWYSTVGKKRYVPTGPDPKVMQKQKKRERQNRRRHHRGHR